MEFMYTPSNAPDKQVRLEDMGPGTGMGIYQFYGLEPFIYFIFTLKKKP